MASLTTVVTDKEGAYNRVADDVLVGEAVKFTAGGAVLLVALELAQQES